LNSVESKEPPQLLLAPANWKFDLDQIVLPDCNGVEILEGTLGGQMTRVTHSDTVQASLGDVP
jgi:hypothetical protein